MPSAVWRGRAMELVCRLSVLGTMPLLQLSGELDLATLPQFRDQLVRAVGEHQGATLYVDVDGLHALDDAELPKRTVARQLAAGVLADEGLELVLPARGGQHVARHVPGHLHAGVDPGRVVDAEIVRDIALSAAGLLVEKFGGPSVKPVQPEQIEK